MAAALFQARAADRLPDWQVSSAGVRAQAGTAAPNEVKVALQARSVELGPHEPTLLTREIVDGANLIIAMERNHLVEVVALAPRSFGRTFLLAEIVSLAERHGPRLGGEVVGTWLERLHAGRRPADVLRLDSSFDIDDPYGGAAGDYERCAARLDELVTALAAVLAGEHAPAKN